MFRFMILFFSFALTNLCANDLPKKKYAIAAVEGNLVLLDNGMLLEATQKEHRHPYQSIGKFLQGDLKEGDDVTFFYTTWTQKGVCKTINLTNLDTDKNFEFKPLNLGDILTVKEFSKKDYYFRIVLSDDSAWDVDFFSRSSHGLSYKQKEKYAFAPGDPILICSEDFPDLGGLHLFLNFNQKSADPLLFPIAAGPFGEPEDDYTGCSGLRD